MITVTVSINGNPIITRSARRILKDYYGYGTYKVDDGNKIRHKVSDGAVDLAIKMLHGVEKI